MAETAVQERRAFMELTEAFFRAGKITQVDVAKARSQLLEAEQGLAEAHSAVRLAREILARSLGLEERAEMDIQGKFSPATEPAGDFADLWRQAETANPEIKRLKTELAQSRALLQAARGGYFPEISLQGSTGVRHRDVGGTREEWLAGVFMEFPLFDPGNPARPAGDRRGGGGHHRHRASAGLRGAGDQPPQPPGGCRRSQGGPGTPDIPARHGGDQ